MEINETNRLHKFSFSLYLELGVLGTAYAAATGAKRDEKPGHTAKVTIRPS